jgi:serine/arginine repetitive matrix protein 1
LGGELQTADRAAWQKYRCAEGSVEARYYKGSAGPEAQIRYKGGILTAAYSAASSDEDLTAFSNGTQTWTIGNEFGNDFYKEGNGFLVHHEQAEGIDGTEATVDNLLLHECTPVS